MAMRSSNSPRRVYPRAGSLVLSLGGTYFGPGGRNKATKINADKEVKTAELDASHGKKRIEVTQKQGKELITETWIETEVVFKPRTTA